MRTLNMALCLASLILGGYVIATNARAWLGLPTDDVKVYVAGKGERTFDALLRETEFVPAELDVATPHMVFGEVERNNVEAAVEDYRRLLAKAETAPPQADPAPVRMPKMDRKSGLSRSESGYDRRSMFERSRAYQRGGFSYSRSGRYGYSSLGYQRYGRNSYPNNRRIIRR